jgi:hypothetical protein
MHLPNTRTRLPVAKPCYASCSTQSYEPSSAAWTDRLRGRVAKLEDCMACEQEPPASVASQDSSPLRLQNIPKCLDLECIVRALFRGSQIEDLFREGQLAQITTPVGGH